MKSTANTSSQPLNLDLNTVCSTLFVVDGDKVVVDGDKDVDDDHEKN